MKALLLLQKAATVPVRSCVHPNKPVWITSQFTLPASCTQKHYSSASATATAAQRRGYLTINMSGEANDNGSKATLVKPPPVDPNNSAIENVLELTTLKDIGPDIFTNTRPLWHPPGARGIYGGAVIAQCLAAAQKTVPVNFTIHSMHCYFVLAGDATIPVLYHVEDVRSGRSFATRTVQARQRGKCIFTTTMSFVRENSGGAKLVQHATPLGSGVSVDAPPPDDRSGSDDHDSKLQWGSPFESKRCGILNKHGDPYQKRTRQWIRARGQISEQGGHQAHLSALAYMSDSYFIGTVSRVHNIWRFANATRSSSSASATEKIKEAADEEMMRKLREEEGFDGDLKKLANQPEIGMMVSLDHSIYFHEPRSFRADEWMFTEMETPWAGDGRGLVQQKMWSKDGTLVATCVQEGVVRLKDEKATPKL